MGANTTGPEFYFPRRPGPADRVWSERRPDLESRPGRLMAMFLYGKATGPHAHPEALPFLD